MCCLSSLADVRLLAVCVGGRVCIPVFAPLFCSYFTNTWTLCHCCIYCNLLTHYLCCTLRWMVFIRPPQLSLLILVSCANSCSCVGPFRLRAPSSLLLAGLIVLTLLRMYYRATMISPSPSPGRRARLELWHFLSFRILRFVLSIYVIYSRTWL